MLEIQLLEAFGNNPYNAIVTCSVAAQGGAALAVGLKTKSAKLKALALPSSLSAFLGIYRASCFRGQSSLLQTLCIRFSRWWCRRFLICYFWSKSNWDGDHGNPWNASLFKWPNFVIPTCKYRSRLQRPLF